MLVITAGLLAVPAPPLWAGNEVLAPTLGDDGLYHHAWFENSLLDLRDDLAAAKAADKRLALIFEVRGCPYCKKLQTEILTRPDINRFVRARFDIVQLNLTGDREVTDFDGKVMSEKQLAARWRVMLSPSIIFLPVRAGEPAKTGFDIEVGRMTGGYDADLVADMFHWVDKRLYAEGITYGQYATRRMAERNKLARQTTN